MSHSRMNSPVSRSPSIIDPRTLCYRRQISRFVAAAILILCGFVSTGSSTAAVDVTDVKIDRYPSWFSNDSLHSSSTAWADFDGDGDLDLAVGNGRYRPGWDSSPRKEKNALYVNDGQELNPIPVLFSNDNDATTSVAWGDMDGDGDLDLVVGNYESSNKIYYNDKGKLSQFSGWSDEVNDKTRSIALGDIDGKGGIDIVVGNYESPTKIYLNNNNGKISKSPIIIDNNPNLTYSIALGDVDRDGDLDLAVGNASTEAFWNDQGEGESLNNWKECYAPQQNTLYENKGDLKFTSILFGSADCTYSLAWGNLENDANSESWLELAVGNYGQANLLYRFRRGSDGNLVPTEAWRDDTNLFTRSISWGDMNSDGNTDVVTANSSVALVGRQDPELIGIYWNQGAALSKEYWESDFSSGAHSVALGDVDGDTDLDIMVGVTGFSPNRIYSNHFSRLFQESSIAINAQGRYPAVVWGDIDHNGLLDIVSGKIGTSEIHLNPTPGSAATTITLPGDNEDTQSVAVGDVNGDSYLDIILGNGIRHGCRPGDNKYPGHQKNRLYITDPEIVYANGQLKPKQIIEIGEADCTKSVALGDVDGDSDLDLIVGDGENNWPVQNKLFINDGNGNFERARQWTPEANTTTTVAWGDVDGDGDLDLGVSNENQPNQVFFNISGMLDNDPGWTALDSDSSSDATWADIDENGLIDLVVGNWNGPNKVYFNHSGNLDRTAGWISNDSDNTRTISAVDFDGDGDIDVVAGNQFQDRLYMNENGVLQTTGTSLTTQNRDVSDMAWGDADNDGDIDLAIGIDPEVGNPNPGIIVLNDYQRDKNNPSFNHIASIKFGPPWTKGNAESYSSAKIISDTSIPIDYILSNADSNISAYYSIDGGGVWYRAKLQNGIVSEKKSPGSYTFDWDTFSSGFFGQSDNVVIRLIASDQPPTYTTGLSAPIAYLNVAPGPFQRPYVSSATLPFRVRGTQIYVQADTNLYQPYCNPVDVHLGRSNCGLNGALIMRQTNDDIPAEFMSDPNNAQQDSRWHTYAGYLQGRGRLNEGDRIISLLEITDTEANIPIASKIDARKLTFYHTSSAAIPTGIAFTNVSPPGEQQLTISQDNKLILFNLDISVEWDSTKDEEYKERLRQDLVRTSEILFDLTNGQAALGHLRIFQGKQHWIESDIQLYARSDLVPNANLGGIVSTTVTYTTPIGKVYPNAFVPGHIRIGSSWNRYGNPNGTVGEDWPRTLAHEIGHYAFFLLDNYLGVSDKGLIEIVDCAGSAMTDPYNPDYSEFLSSTSNSIGYTWNTKNCQHTLAQQTVGASDWNTIRQFYPFDENLAQTDDGPQQLPLNITQIEFVPPTLGLARTADNDTFAAPFVYLNNPDGTQFTALRGDAQAYLVKTRGTLEKQDDEVIALGSFNGSLIRARGAAPDDQICVFHTAANPLGIKCKTIQMETTTLELENAEGWQPEIRVTPKGSASLVVTVTQQINPGESIHIQIFPSDRPTVTARAPVTVASNATSNIHVATQPFSQTVLSGFIRIWVSDTDFVRQAIVPFYIPTGWDGRQYVAWDGRDYVAWDGRDYVAWDGRDYVAWDTRVYQLVSENMNSWSAPLASPDGRVRIFNIQNILDGYVASILQPLEIRPRIDSWLTPIGSVYQYRTAPIVDEPPKDLIIQFQYLQRELPPISEDNLKIYFSPDNGATWERIGKEGVDDTEVDDRFNLASAKMRGDGLYALMATIDTPGLYSGWNQFSYPETNRRLINTAIASIAKDYMAVAKQVTQGEDRKPVPAQWRLYDPRVALEHPEFSVLVNDLQTMQPLESYWVFVVTDTVPYIGVPVADDTQQIRASGVTELPPATFYGYVEPVPEIGFYPNPGDEIVAMIDESVCGRSTVLASGPPAEHTIPEETAYKLYLPYVGGTGRGQQLFYKIQVRADTGEGCGVFGHDVTFYVNGQKLESNHPWGNSQACFHALGPKSYAPPTDCFRAPAPDLIVKNVKVMENDVQVVVENIGTAEVPAGAGFWVDAYIDPDPNHRPYFVNDIWQNFTRRGIAWALVDLSEPIDPGGTFTLTVGSQYFVPEESNIDGGWSADTIIYAQVDSAHANTHYGGVLEGHEILGEPYNNVWAGTQTSTVVASAVSQADVTSTSGGLPPRR